MIFPDVEPGAWMEMHGLRIRKYKCPQCKGSFDIDIAILTTDCVGLTSSDHGCGPGMSGYTLKPRTKEAKKFWKEVMK